MPEEKQHATPLPTAEFNRRAFFTKIGLGSLGITAVGTMAFAYEFLSPNVLYEPSPIVNAGKPENFAPDSVTMDVNSGIYLVRTAGRVLCPKRSLHSSGMPYQLEPGARNHHLPLSWKPLPTNWPEDRGARSEASTLASNLGRRRRRPDGGPIDDDSADAVPEDMRDVQQD